MKLAGWWWWNKLVAKFWNVEKDVCPRNDKNDDSGQWLAVVDSTWSSDSSLDTMEGDERRQLNCSVICQRPLSVIESFSKKRAEELNNRRQVSEMSDKLEANRDDDRCSSSSQALVQASGWEKKKKKKKGRLGKGWTSGQPSQPSPPQQQQQQQQESTAQTVTGIEASEVMRSRCPDGSLLQQAMRRRRRLRRRSASSTISPFGQATATGNERQLPLNCGHRTTTTTETDTETETCSTVVTASATNQVNRGQSAGVDSVRQVTPPPPLSPLSPLSPRSPIVKQQPTDTSQLYMYPPPYGAVPMTMPMHYSNPAMVYPMYPHLSPSPPPMYGTGESAMIVSAGGTTLATPIGCNNCDQTKQRSKSPGLCCSCPCCNLLFCVYCCLCWKQMCNPRHV